MQIQDENKAYNKEVFQARIEGREIGLQMVYEIVLDRG